MSNFITRKDYAAEKGVRRQRVDKLVTDGRIKVNKDGLIDRAQAEKVWAELSPAHVEKEALAKEIASGTPKGSESPILKARTLEAVVRAKQRELAYRREAGELVPVSEVKLEAFEIGRALQQRLLAFPARLSAELATQAALPSEKVEPSIRAILAREVRLIVDNLMTAIDQLQSSRDTGT